MEKRESGKSGPEVLGVFPDYVKIFDYFIKNFFDHPEHKTNR